MDSRSTNSRSTRFAWRRCSTATVLALIAAATPGCAPQPVTGGTRGVLRAGGEPVSEIQITVHRAEAGASRAIGFGVARSEGAFELVTNEAQDALSLVEGDYKFTLESIGAPVRIPPEYTDPERTPLSAVWSGGDEVLELNLPKPLAAP